ncbi:hypothetical protein ACRYCC_15700 [Actinomadura scrupuli]|uniref:hypothetical protein n=1 Tax=Actinomadura scrupuli TaxID=559629 RepID=UPI003D9838FB
MLLVRRGHRTVIDHGVVFGLGGSAVVLATGIVVAASMAEPGDDRPSPPAAGLRPGVTSHPVVRKPQAAPSAAPHVRKPGRSPVHVAAAPPAPAGGKPKTPPSAPTVRRPSPRPPAPQHSPSTAPTHGTPATRPAVTSGCTLTVKLLNGVLVKVCL